jgi:hypothetical protein
VKCRFFELLDHKADVGGLNLSADCVEKGLFWENGSIDKNYLLLKTMG